MAPECPLCPPALLKQQQRGHHAHFHQAATPGRPQIPVKNADWKLERRTGPVCIYHEELPGAAEGGDSQDRQVHTVYAMWCLHIKDLSDIVLVVVAVSWPPVSYCGGLTPALQCSISVLQHLGAGADPLLDAAAAGTPRGCRLA